MNVRTATVSDIPSLALIHVHSLPNDFLPSLGQDFLEKVYYPAALVSRNAKTLVAEKDGAIAGFVTIAHESERFSRDVLRGRWFKIATYAMRAALRDPLHLIKSFKVLWSVMFSKPDPIKSEIVFIAVKQEHRNQGFGKTLVRASMEYLRSQNMFACRTKTLAENVSVIDMYEKMGWHVRNRLRLIGHEYVIIAAHFTHGETHHPTCRSQTQE